MLTVTKFPTPSASRNTSPGATEPLRTALPRSRTEPPADRESTCHASPRQLTYAWRGARNVAGMTMSDSAVEPMVAPLAGMVYVRRSRPQITSNWMG